MIKQVQYSNQMEKLHYNYMKKQLMHYKVNLNQLNLLVVWDNNKKMFTSQLSFIIYV